MPKPQPNILSEIHNNTTGKTNQIIASKGEWAVYYDGSPINLRVKSIAAFVALKYKSVSFANKGHAINLAKKLNKQTSTNRFTVVILTHAKVIYEE